MRSVTTDKGPGSAPRGLTIADAARLAPAEVAERLGSTLSGLTEHTADERLRAVGPNALKTHHAQPVEVLARQFRSPLLLLLIVTAAVSFFVGDRTDAVTIGVILAMSVLLGFVNEYRAEKAGEALHDELRHYAVAERDGTWVSRDVTELVP